MANLAPCPVANLTSVHQLDSMGPAFSFQKCVYSSARNREKPKVIKYTHLFRTCFHHQKLVVVVEAHKAHWMNFGNPRVSRWFVGDRPPYQKASSNTSRIKECSEVHQPWELPASSFSEKKDPSSNFAYGCFQK